MDAQQTQESAADRPLHVFEIGPDRDIERRCGERFAVALQETGVKFAEEDDA